VSAPDPLDRMMQRVAQCRRLAATTIDERTAGILRQMAEEGEADMKRLRAERSERVDP